MHEVIFAGIQVDFISIGKYYCLSFGFFVDVFSILPFELFCLLADRLEDRQHMFTLGRLNRLVKMYQVRRLNYQTTSVTKNTISANV